MLKINGIESNSYGASEESVDTFKEMANEQKRQRYKAVANRQYAETIFKDKYVAAIMADYRNHFNLFGQTGHKDCIEISLFENENSQIKNIIADAVSAIIAAIEESNDELGMAFMFQKKLAISDKLWKNVHDDEAMEDFFGDVAASNISDILDNMYSRLATL